MASLDEVISKIPKPLLVGGVFIIALALIIYSNPLKDGCDVQILNFTDNVKGYLINTKTKSKKLKIAEVEASKDFCKAGNSPGACENYFAALDRIAKAFVTFDDKCIPQLSEDETFKSLQPQIKDGLKILALYAWGEKPPDGVASRTMIIAKNEIYTFCRLKKVLLDILGEDDFKSFRLSVYKEFPDNWSDEQKNQATITSAEEIQRPTALKSTGNPGGTLTEEEIFQRSLFSLRCDQYQ